MCVTTETKDVNVSTFNMIAQTDENKTLVKHILCDCKSRFDSTTRYSNQEWSNDKCQCEFKKYRTCKRRL